MSSLFRPTVELPLPFPLLPSGLLLLCGMAQRFSFEHRNLKFHNIVRRHPPRSTICRFWGTCPLSATKGNILIYSSPLPALNVLVIYPLRVRITQRIGVCTHTRCEVSCRVARFSLSQSHSSNSAINTAHTFLILDAVTICTERHIHTIDVTYLIITHTLYTAQHS